MPNSPTLTSGQQKTALLVLGMHRSGTSAVTRFLNLLGADLPKHLMRAKAGNNSSGFWESEEIYQLNERLLSSLNSRWDDWRQCDPNSLPAESYAEFLEEAVSITRRNFSETALFVIKDPRICRLLPFWEQAFRQTGIKIKCIIPLRHPHAVAASLNSRDGFSKEKGLALWLRHVLEAEHQSRDLERCWVVYDDLLADWRHVQRAICTDLELALKQATPAIQQEIDGFLDPQQRHHQKEDVAGQASELDRWATAAHEILLRMHQGQQTPTVAIQELDSIKGKLNQAESLLGEVFGDELLERKHLEVRFETALRTTQNKLDNRIARVDTLEVVAKERQVEINALGSSIADQNQAIEELRQQLTERAERAQMLDQLASARAAEIQSLQTRGHELQRIIDERMQRVAELETLAQQRRAQLQERMQRVAELETLAQQRREQLQERAQQLQDRVQKITQLENIAQERRDRICQLEQQCAELKDLSRQRKLEELQLRQRLAKHHISTKTLGLAPRRAFSKKLNTVEMARLFKQARYLLKSQLFDPHWYLLAYPDVADAPWHPIWHWLLIGCDEGRNPNAVFDVDWYLRQSPDVKQAGLNPLFHYISHGHREGRNPGPLFDADWYRETYPDVAKANTLPLQHYLAFGRAEKRQPNSLFNPSWYLDQHADVQASGLDAFEHFLLTGGREGRHAGPNFPSDWYLANNSDVAKSGMNPLFHYLGFGKLEGRAKFQDEIDSLNPKARPQAKISSKEIPTFVGRKTAVNGWHNIVLCAHSAHGHLFGGERSFLDILALLNQLDFNVYVILPAHNTAYLSEILPHVVEVAEIGYSYWTKDRAPDGSAIRAIQSYLVSRKADLVHINTIVVREPLLAAKKLGIPTALHVRENLKSDSWITQMMGDDSSQLLGQVLSNADAVIANSIFTAKEFHKPNCTFVVPNTFDFDALNLAPRANSQGDLCVGLISSNIPKKGLKDFVQLAAACHKKSTTLQFLLIGPRNEHIAELESQQRLGKLPKNIHFTGYKESPVSALELVDIVVNFSHFAESFGRTIAEGLAARRPAIVYDHGAVSDLVTQEKSGFILPFKQWEHAVPLLLSLDQDRERLTSMGEYGRKAIQQRFDRPAGISALKAAYDSLLTQKPRHIEPREITTLCTRKDILEPNQQQLRLAYFCWHFPVPSETFVLNELRQLVQTGIDVSVFCRQSPHQDFQPDFDIHWERVTSPEDLAERLKQQDRNFVHAHFTYPTVTEMVWPACELAGIPFSFIAHAQDIFKHDNDANNKVGEVASASLCRSVFTLGRFHRDFLLARGVPSQKLVINPNGIDTNLFPYSPPLIRAKDEPGRICAIHRLTEKKGLDVLIEAAERLKDENLVFNLYGYGDQEAALKAAIAQRQLAKVKIHGPLHSRDDILEVLRSHHLFAAPSVRTESGDMDGIPTVLVESMAVGTPVITTDVASIPDLVQDASTGIITAPNNVDSLVDGIQRYFQFDEAQITGLSRNARSAVELQHDTHRLTKRLMRFWQQRTVDIVIVSWNSLIELREVVGHIYQYTKSPFHLIICDNASEIDVTSYLFELHSQHNNITIVHKGHNSMVGPGTNAATEKGRSDYVIYVCGREGFALADGWEDRMIDFMDEHPQHGLAGSLGYSPTYFTGADYPNGIDLFGKFRNQHFASENENKRFAHVQGGLFIFRRSMYESIGGFSDAVPHAYTDVEYSFYAESEGWELGSIPHVLALYNKTTPNYWSRIDEHTKVVHPPTLADLGVLHGLVEQQRKLCNICQWSGKAFQASNVCPNCASTSQDRALYRHLAEGELTFRRLPALWLNPSSSLLSFWRKSFQGRQLSFASLDDEVNRLGRIDAASNSQSLMVWAASSAEAASVDEAFIDELARILKSNCPLIILQSEQFTLLANPRLEHMLHSSGFTLRQEVVYRSAATAMDLRPMLIFHRREKLDKDCE